MITHSKAASSSIDYTDTATAPSLLLLITIHPYRYAYFDDGGAI